MFYYALVDQDGRIHQTGSAPTQEFALPQIEQHKDLTVIEGEYNYDTDYFVDGEVRKYPEKPQGFFEFDYVNKTWFDPRSVDEIYSQAATEVKNKRKHLLDISDWTQVPDAPVDQASWQVYRQALRDITEQEGFPLNIIWPQPPQ